MPNRGSAGLSHEINTGKADTKPMIKAGWRFKLSAFRINHPRTPAAKVRANDANGDVANHSKMLIYFGSGSDPGNGTYAACIAK